VTQPLHVLKGNNHPSFPAERFGISDREGQQVSITLSRVKRQQPPGITYKRPLVFTRLDRE